MTDVTKAEVLIVGGGMVGLALAAALGRGGIGTVVVDRAPPEAMTDAGHDGRTSAIAYGSQRMLDGIGAWNGMVRDAAPILDIRVADGDAPLFLHYDHRALGDAPLGWIVENRGIRQALLALVRSLPGVRLLAPATLETIERTAAGVTARLADGGTIRAALAVGAEGRRSGLRRDAGIRTAEWTYAQTGIVCTAAHERPHRHVAHERFLPAGPFAILPMTDGADPETGAPVHRSSIVWTERAELAPRLLGLDRAAFDAELARRFGDFYGTVRAIGRRWSYPLGVMLAERYVDRRLALVGDSAHVIHPIAGQGLNLGLRDMAVLAETLVDAHRLGLDLGSAGVLARYQRQRRFDALTLVAVTDGLNRLFSNRSEPLRLVRELGLAAVDRLPPLKRFFMRHAMGMTGELPRLVRGEPL